MKNEILKFIERRREEIKIENIQEMADVLTTLMYNSREIKDIPSVLFEYYKELVKGEPSTLAHYKRIVETPKKEKDRYLIQWLKEIVISGIVGEIKKIHQERLKGNVSFQSDLPLTYEGIPEGEEENFFQILEKVLGKEEKPFRKEISGETEILRFNTDLKRVQIEERFNVRDPRIFIYKIIILGDREIKF